jgi:ankyrin repeat protein
MSASLGASGPAASPGAAGAAAVVPAPMPAATPPSPAAVAALVSSTTAAGPTDLFVSYPWGPVDPATGKRPVQERVQTVVAQLRAAGFSAWLDLERMASDATGDSGTDEAMGEGILDASAFVCFFSAEYARSPNCKLEAQFAKKKNKPMFFVNVGAPGYMPDRYNKDERSIVMWLDVLVMDALWFDARDVGHVAENIAKLIVALKANAEVTCSGGGGTGSDGTGGGAAAEAELARLRAKLAAVQKRNAAAQARPMLPAAEARAKGEQLLKACEEKHAEDALQFINEGASVDVAGEGGHTPLIAASSKGLEAVAARLVEASAVLDLVDETGMSALLHASQQGHIAIAQLLADKGAMLNLVQNDGWSALMYASYYGHAEIAQVLAYKGALLDLVLKDGRTALIFASYSGHTFIAQLLANKGAKLELADEGGFSALMYASFYGHAATAQLLIDKGADVKRIDAAGRTSLAFACCGGHAATAQLLVARMDAAALNLVDKFCKTALDYADEGGEGKDKVAELAPAAAAIRARGGRTGVEIDPRITSKQLLKACEFGRVADALQLINEGADVHVFGEDGRTPLIWASEKGLASVSAQLVGAGAKLDIVDKDSRTALMRASINGHTAIAQLLAEKGAELDIKARSPCVSALMLASANGHASIAQLLVDKCAKLDLVDGVGKSALISACFYGHAAIAQLLTARMDAAALNLVDNAGKSALDYADEGGEGKNMVVELAPAAAAIRACGGLTAIELAASAVAARAAAADLALQLVQACKAKDEDRALALLAAGASVRAADADGKTARDYCAGLLFGFSLNRAGPAVKAAGGRTGVKYRAKGKKLHEACADDLNAYLIIFNAEEAERLANAALWLIHKGAGLDFADKNGVTTLMRAASLRGFEAVAARLVEAGAKLDLLDNGGRSALIRAAKTCRTANVRLLANKGAKLDLVDEDGRTALIWACFNGSLDSVRLLLARTDAASLNRVDISGKTILDYMSKGGYKDHMPIVSTIRARGGLFGIEIDRRGNGGRQLLAACEDRWLEEGEVLRLVNEGADVDLAGKGGRTPLMNAARNSSCSTSRSKAAIERLIGVGTKLDLVDEGGRSALIWACFNCHTAAAQLLTAHMTAAALNLVDNIGKTALDWADEGGLSKEKVAELAPVAAAIRARGGLTAAELNARK